MKNGYLILIISTFLNLFAYSQNQQGVQLLYHWENTSLVSSSAHGNVYNEVWGFVQGGREYAVIGSTDGTHIFDVTDPANAYEAAFVAGKAQGTAIVHRDYHDYNGYLYAVCDEGNSSLQIIDLSNLPTSVNVVYDSDALLNKTHNIFIDTAHAKLYACGVTTAAPQLIDMQVYSLANPISPTWLTDYTTVGYIHDTYVRNDTAYLNAGLFGLYIVDFSNTTTPSIIGSLTSYPFKGYNHSGWLSDDGNTYIMADENHGHEMKSIDVSDLSNITVLNTFISGEDSQSIPHNQLIKGNHLFVSHYHDGLQIFDISDPSDVQRIGYYDTYTPGDHTAFRGAWGVYPYLPSGNILVSDMQYGLFVLELAQNIGIKEPETKPDVSLYPNPASDHINITLAEKPGNDTSIEILDLSGKLIHRAIPESTNSKINLPDRMESGIYVLKMQQGTAAIVKKLVKK